jgi:hypothetical protein
MSLATVARNLLVHEGGPVMIVADADTRAADQILEHRGILRLALQHVSQEKLFDVFLFAPEIEVLIFEAPSVLDQITQGLSRKAALVDRGRQAPHKTLASALAGRSITDWIDALDESSLADLRSGNQATQLLAAVRRLVPVDPSSLLVGPHKGEGWQARKSGSYSVGVLRKTQSEMMDRGRELAKRESLEHTIQGPSSATRRKDGKGGEPRRRKDQ